MLFQKELSPDIEQVAQAIARKLNWRIEVSGESALNILNLSTQIQAKYIYLSDGPNKSYKLFNDVVIEFKKSVLKDIGFKYKESSLIVQALKSLGKEHITDEIIEKIKEQIEPKMYKKILKDTQKVRLYGCMRLSSKFVKVIAMNKVANLSKEQRKELFSETAALINTTNAIVEKDFWVVWTLSKIFEDERLNKILIYLKLQQF